jgi:phosphoglycolate phosphatase
VITLAVLDMAGTTVSDDGVVTGAFEDVLDELKIVGERRDRAVAYVIKTMGMSKIDVFQYLVDERADEANGIFERSYENRVRAGEVVPIDGAEAAIERLRASGVRVCLTTGFSPATRDVLLDSIGWRDVGDLALSPADAGRGRPYPDMVLAAAVRLGVDDVRDIAVAGDTANDLLSGSRAGASVVAGVLTGAHSREQLEEAPHTHIIESVVALPDLIRPSEDQQGFETR